MSEGRSKGEKAAATCQQNAELEKLEAEQLMEEMRGKLYIGSKSRVISLILVFTVILTFQRVISLITMNI